MSVKAHRCIRCGIDVYVRGAMCKDCRSTDPRFNKHKEN